MYYHQMCANNKQFRKLCPKTITAHDFNSVCDTGVIRGTEELEEALVLVHLDHVLDAQQPRVVHAKRDLF